MKIIEEYKNDERSFICTNTGERFTKYEEAAKKFNLTKKKVIRVLRGEIASLIYYDKKNRILLDFEYENEELKNQYKEKKEEANNYFLEYHKFHEIRCINTGEEFYYNSFKDIAKKYDIDKPNYIYKNLRGVGSIPIKNGIIYDFEFIDEELKNQYKEKKEKLKENLEIRYKIKLGVRCITTGKEFKNVKEACEYYNMPTKISCLRKVLKNKRGYTGFIIDEYGNKINLEWEYVDKELRKKYENNKIKINRNSNSIKCRCITTGKEFNSISEACRYYNIKNDTSLGTVLKGKGKYCGKLQDGTELEWEYVDEELRNKYKNNKNNKNIKCRCITTGKEFNSIIEACRYYNIKNDTSLGRALKGKGKYCGRLQDGTELKWEYVDEELRKKYENNKIEINKNNNYNKRIRCINTGEEFNNSTLAFEAYKKYMSNEKRNRIMETITTKKNYKIFCGKFENGDKIFWEYADDSLNNKELSKRKRELINKSKTQPKTKVKKIKKEIKKENLTNIYNRFDEVKTKSVKEFIVNNYSYIIIGKYLYKIENNKNFREYTSIGLYTDYGITKN